VKSAPKECDVTLIDVHCHLDASAYRDLETVCRQSQQAGVSIIVATGTGRESNERILGLQRWRPAQIWAALGLHPERLDASWEELEAVIAQLQEHRPQLVALGEIGLPYYALADQRLTQSQAQQCEAFLHMLVRAAVQLSLPVVLHAPHATAAIALNIVKRYQPPGALFHWHKSPSDITAAICQAGYFVSITPEVCYRERERRLAQTVPLSSLLLESDGPWPYGGEFAGQLTTPALVARVAAEVARLKALPLTEVQEVTTANAQRLFGHITSHQDSRDDG
jgi:TatD DNase family protein